MKNISRHYENLTSMQRIALAIESMARGDIQELDHLDSSCPRKSYYGIDRAYAQGLGELHSLALLYETEVLSRLVRVVAIQGVFIRLYHPDENEDDGRLDGYLDSLHILQAEIRGWHGAWSEFCASFGMEPATVLKAFGIRFPRRSQVKAGPLNGGCTEIEKQTWRMAVSDMAEILNSIVRN